MSIRLNKVIKELNVGIQTAVSFLQKKGFDVESNPSTKITDEQYELLVKEFSTDKELKIESERFNQERQKEKKAAQEEIEEAPKEIETVIDDSLRPHLKSVGKIDLDNLYKKPVEKKPEPAVDEEPKKEIVKEPVKKTAAPAEETESTKPADTPVSEPQREEPQAETATENRPQRRANTASSLAS